jgi:hypothetical protein
LAAVPVLKLLVPLFSEGLDLVVWMALDPPVVGFGESVSMGTIVSQSQTVEVNHAPPVKCHDVYLSELT